MAGFRCTLYWSLQLLVELKEKKAMTNGAKALKFQMAD